MKPPPRLIHDPSAAPKLREDLERTAAAPFAFDAAAGLAGLQAAVAALGASGADSAAAAGAQAAAEPVASSAAAASAAPASTTVAAKGTLLGTTGGKLALAAAGAAVIGASVLAWPGATPPRRSEPARPAPAPVAAPATASAPESSRAQLPAAPPPAAAAAPTPATRGITPALRDGAMPVARDAIDVELDRIRDRAAQAGNGEAAVGLRREIAELGQIKALLQTRPAEAYRLAQSGHRRFRRGMLRHEREGLAVLALFELERRGEAIARTRAFLTRYPASPLRTELERRLQSVVDAAPARETR